MKRATHSDKNWQEEIASLPPLLQSIADRQAWLLPDGYFESLPQQILLRTNTPQQVPQDYFDTLPARTIKRIHLEAEQDTPTEVSTNSQSSKTPEHPAKPVIISTNTANRNSENNIRSLWKIISTAAAMVSALIVYVLWPAQPAAPDTLAHLSEQEITQYILRNVDEWATEQLLELSPDMPPYIFDTTATHLLEDYLFEHADINDLQNFL